MPGDFPDKKNGTCGCHQRKPEVEAGRICEIFGPGADGGSINGSKSSEQIVAGKVGKAHA
jgi:hypothetical protein